MVGENGVIAEVFSGVSGTTNGSGSSAVFKVRHAQGTYQVIATVGGHGYKVGDTVHLTGTGYNCVATVSAVDGNGSIETLAV
jgi:hypothetical protein